MVGTSQKILTVSYGTFSCTLEGFDDSFSTMKAIAEYFRDLAADDRYFGAEPPTPDAEMLARIAEREIARRVEARLDGNDVVLRAEAPALDAPAEAPSETPAPEATEPETPEIAEEAVEEVPTPAETEAPTVAEEALDEAAASEAADDMAIDAEAEDEHAEAVAEDEEAEAVAENKEAEDEEAEVLPAFAMAQLIPDDVEPDAPLEIADEPIEAEAVAEPVAETPVEEPAPVEAVTEEEIGDDAWDMVPEAAPAPEADTDSIAAKLQRIRAVVTEEGAPAFAEEEDAEDLAATDMDTDSGLSAVMGVVDAAPEIEESTLPAASEFAALDEDLFDEEEDLFAEEEEIAVAAEEPAVAEAEAEDAQEPEFAEEDVTGPLSLTPEALVAIYEPADPQDTADLEMIDGLYTSEEAPSDMDAAPEDAPLDESAAAQEDPAVAEAEETEEAETEADDDAALASGLDVARRARARVIKVKRAELEEAVEDGLFEPEEAYEPNMEAYADRDQGDDSLFGDAFDGPAEADTEATSLFAEDAPKDTEELAAETALEEAKETALEETEVDEEALVADADDASDADDVDDDAALAASISAAIGDTSLSDEDEAALMAELADVQRDAEAPTNAELEGRAALEEGGVTDDREGEVSRLLDKAESELAEPEGDRRRSAIAHLKAAVAATKAEREVAGEPADEDATEDYRDDLAQVVRPRRATPVHRDTPRPSVVPPLKLVAEQRVDIDAPAPQPAETAPVRPRRVAVKSPDELDAAAANASSFAEFAESMGAEALPDLLEAAAAYTAYVQGQPHFSRPQVMKQVARVRGDGGFSREDGLRSFGQLLRQGKIQKLKRGQFVVSDDTRFKPEARIAGE